MIELFRGELSPALPQRRYRGGENGRFQSRIIDAARNVAKEGDPVRYQGEARMWRGSCVKYAMVVDSYADRGYQRPTLAQIDRLAQCDVRRRDAESGRFETILRSRRHSIELDVTRNPVAIQAGRDRATFP